MPNRSRKVATHSSDPNVVAFNAIQEIIERGEAKKAEEAAKDPLAVALGRRGGLKGGKARAKAMTPAQRRASALKAARARWDRTKRR